MPNGPPGYTTEYNTHSIVEHQQLQDQAGYERDELAESSKKHVRISSITSAVDTSSDSEDTQSGLGNDHSIDEGLIEDHQFESTHISRVSRKTSIRDFETRLPSVLSISDRDISTEKLEHELANVHMKTKNIEEMIDKFLSDP